MTSERRSHAEIRVALQQIDVNKDDPARTGPSDFLTFKRLNLCATKVTVLYKTTKQFGKKLPSGIPTQATAGSGAPNVAKQLRPIATVVTATVSPKTEMPFGDFF